MLKIGLTGGIGSGKSVVADIFKVFGVPAFNADAAAKNIMENSTELKAAIIGEFGEESYASGTLNRKYLATIVFNDAFRLEKLNALVHPFTIAAAEEWALQQTSPYVIKEAALFFEAGSAIGFDYMVGVSAPRSIRIKRVMERDTVTREEVLSRMSRQIDEQIKMRLCDFVIINDDRHLLIEQVLPLHERFISESKQSRNE